MVCWCPASLEMYLAVTWSLLFGESGALAWESRTSWWYVTLGLSVALGLSESFEFCVSLAWCLVFG